MNLLKQTPKLCGEPLIYHGIKLFANEKVRIGEQNRTDQIVSGEKQNETVEY